MLRAHLAVVALFAFGCYSAADGDGDGGGNGNSNGNGGNGSGASGGSGSVGGGGGKGGTTGASGGSGDAGSGGALAQGGTGGAGTSTGGAGGSSAGSSGSSGSGGGSNECAIDSYTFAVSQTTSSCGFPLRDLYDSSIVTIYFIVGGSQQPICRHADSQGCELSGGYWWAGNEIAFCDETCGLLDVEGGYFVAVRGCETEYCSY